MKARRVRSDSLIRGARRISRICDEFSTRSCTNLSIRRAAVAPSSATSSAGSRSGSSTPARIASSMSWLMYATRSTSFTIRPSSVAGAVGPVWFRMPSRTSCVRFSPRPSRSRCSTMRSECSLCRKRRPVAASQRVGERLLAGVAERRVPEVVPERDRLGQVLVQLQRAGHRARDPDHLQRVRQARAVVVALRRDEHLRLVLEPAERLGVDDAVAIALERRAQRALLLGLARGRAWRSERTASGARRRSSSARMRASKRAATGPSPSGITPPRAPSGAAARRT